MSYQQTKYLFEATTDTGEDIVIDFMKIESYTEIDHLIHIKMSAGTLLIIQSNIIEMKKIANEIGIPVHSGTISPLP